MKYFLIVIAIATASFSCKCKKEIAHSNNHIIDTFYIPNPENGELAMHVTDKYYSPDGDWMLQGINGKSNEEVQRITMEFNTVNSENSISGYDGCNSYTATYKLFDKKRLQIGSIASTERVCIVEAKFADLYYSLLKKVKTYSAAENHMVFKDENGTQLLEFKRKE